MCGANRRFGMKNESMRILLIDTAYLGDLVLATPLVRAASECSGQGKIDVMTSPAGAQVLANHPLVDDMYVFHKRGSQRGIAGMRAAISWIRGRAPQTAIMPRRSLRSLMVARMAGVPRRIGFHHGLSRLLLTHPVPFRTTLHQVERNLELLRPLGVDPSGTGKPGHPLEVFPSRRDRDEADDWLKRVGPVGGLVLKSGSPSCAMASAKLWCNGKVIDHTAAGLFAVAISEQLPDLPMIEVSSRTTELHSFIERVERQWHNGLS